VGFAVVGVVGLAGAVMYARMRGTSIGFPGGRAITRARRSH
jgi:hypothetical protein